MNYLDFYINDNGGLSCKMTSSKNIKKSFYGHRTNIILDNMEKELYKDRFKLSYDKGTITLIANNSTLYFHDYKEMREELKKHVPRLVNSFDRCVERTHKKKVIKARKTTLKAVVFASILAGSINAFETNLNNDSNIRTVNAGDLETVKEYSLDEFEDLGPNQDIIMESSSLLSNSVKEEDAMAEPETEVLKSLELENPETVSEEPVMTDEVSEPDIPTLACEIDIDCEENSHNDEIVGIQDNYRDIADEIGNKWGVSSNLVLGMLTQESHGESTNLMQIQPWSVADEVMNIYNFQTGSYQKIVVTSNPGKYGSDVITITKEDLNNPYTNISVAVALYRHILNTYSNNNPVAAIEIYNKGIGNFNKIIRKTSNATGLSSDQLLNDLENTDYLSYSYVCGQGDPNYVANIMQYVDGDITILMVNEDGEEYQITYEVNKTQERELNR